MGGEHPAHPHHLPDAHVRPLAPRRDSYRVLLEGTQTFNLLYINFFADRPRRSRIPFVGRFLGGVHHTFPRSITLPAWQDEIIAVHEAAAQDSAAGLSTEGVLGLEVGEEIPVQITREEFDFAVDVLRRSGFPIERSPDDAWLMFKEARSPYEFPAYAIMRRLDAVPAPWTGDRKPVTPVIWPTLAVDLLPKSYERSRPERGVGKCPKLVAKRERLASGVQDNTHAETRTEFLAQESQPRKVARADGTAGLHLKPCDSSVRRFEHEVDFDAVTIPEVEYSGLGLRPAQLATNFTGGERLKLSSRRIADRPGCMARGVTLLSRAASPVSSSDTLGRPTTRFVRLFPQAGRLWIKYSVSSRSTYEVRLVSGICESLANHALTSSPELLAASSVGSRSRWASLLTSRASADTTRAT